MGVKRVIVVPYDSKWSNEFYKIKSYLQKALENTYIAIEHVGSTSVEGLYAKPIIDIDAVIESYDVFKDVESRLEICGYRYEGDLGIKGREAFKYRGEHEFMAHHLYVCPQDSGELRRHIAFRDYLRTHKADMEKYGEVKIQAAKMYPTDIDSYIAAKGPFIAEIYKKIGL